MTKQKPTAKRPEHSKLGASSMYRWSQCPGSVALCEGIESKSSKYADEGSDAHALLAHCLNKEETPGFYVDKQVSFYGRTFTPNDDMAEAVQIALDAILEVYQDGGKMWVEQKFDLSEVHPDCYGTADCVIWQEEQQILWVFDYKHGAGKFVKVENNPQLMYYGLGALLALDVPAKEIRLVIAQPRCGDASEAIRRWDIDAIDLVNFRADLKKYAEATEQEKPELKAGEWCQFCPAAGVPGRCKAITDKKQENARREFAPSMSYNPDDLRKALDDRPILAAYLKNLDEFAYGEATRGVKIPGYKLVAKQGRRKFVNEDDVKSVLDGLVPLDQITEPAKLKSPAQIEKIVGKGILDDLIITPSSGHALVPESDKRPAVKQTAVEDFTNVKT